MAAKMGGKKVRHVFKPTPIPVRACDLRRLSGISLFSARRYPQGDILDCCRYININGHIIATG